MDQDRAWVPHQGDRGRRQALRGGGSTIVMSSTGDGVEDGGLHPGCSRGGGMLWAGVKDGRERHWCLGHKDGERWKREHGA
jgi:hypothetical protein